MAKSRGLRFEEAPGHRASRAAHRMRLRAGTSHPARSTAGSQAPAPRGSRAIPMPVAPHRRANPMAIQLHTAQGM